jgi:hypothetical protein
MRPSRVWMRPSRVVDEIWPSGGDIVEGLKRLNTNAKVAKVQSLVQS